MAFALLMAAPSWSAPLRFGEIGSSSDLSKRSDVASCMARDVGYSCSLKRKLFGALPITAAPLSLDASGRVRSLELLLDREDYDRAHQLLDGRYGKPDREGLWRFDDGATISLGRRAPYAVVTFDFPNNRAVSRDREPALIWAALGFTCAGIGAGMVLHSTRRRQLRLPAPISMKQVLEQRLREGRDFQL